MDIFELLQEYGGNGQVIGNSGIYRRHDEGSTESMEDFSARVKDALQGHGEWGTEGRPADALFNNGFVNSLAPVDVNGKSYQRVGEDITSPEFRQRLLSNDPKGNIARYFNQYDPSSIYQKNAQYGDLMEKDKYDELVRAIGSTKPNSWTGDNSPFDSFGKTIGPAMGLGSAFSLASTLGSSFAASALADSGYESLWSGLAQNAASQGGSFSDILGNFGMGGTPPAMTGDFPTNSPWGVNQRLPSIGDFGNDTGAFDQAASAGVFDSYGNPLYQGPSGFQNLLGSLQGQLDGVNSALGSSKNPISLLDIGKVGGNFLLQSALANKFLGAANTASDKANALNDPRRQQFQGQLSQLLTNPQQFFSTNPAVQGQLDVARQQFNANTAKMGTGGTQFNDYLKNVQNIASGTFNDQANLLAGLGGFNQGAGFSGNVFGSLAGQGINQQAQAFAGIPDILKKVFGGIGGSGSGSSGTTQNPSGSTTASSF